MLLLLALSQGIDQSEEQTPTKECDPWALISSSEARPIARRGLLLASPNVSIEVAYVLSPHRRRTDGVHTLGFLHPAAGALNHQAPESELLSGSETVRSALAHPAQQLDGLGQTSRVLVASPPRH